MEKRYKTIVELPSIPIGSIFTLDEESNSYFLETAESVHQYAAKDITDERFFEPFTDEDEEMDDNNMMLTTAKDIIDNLPMTAVAEIYNYIQEHRLYFIELPDMKRMIEESKEQ